MVGTFVLLCVIACCEGARRNSPMNLILLGAFTLCESLMVGFISSTYQVKEVRYIKAIVDNWNKMFKFLIVLGNFGNRINNSDRHRLDIVCISNQV